MSPWGPFFNALHWELQVRLWQNLPSPASTAAGTKQTYRALIVKIIKPKEQTDNLNETYSFHVLSFAFPTYFICFAFYTGGQDQVLGQKCLMSHGSCELPKAWAPLLERVVQNLPNFNGRLQAMKIINRFLHEINTRWRTTSRQSIEI